VILAIAVLALGLYPKMLTDLMEPTVQNLLHHIMQSKLPGA